MEKIAIISDIHGNLTALTAVLEDIKKRNINRIFCLGDIVAKGAFQHECINLVKKNCEVVLRGNCDNHFSKDIDLSLISDKKKNRFIWDKSQLSFNDIDYLKSLPYCYEFYMSGRLVRLFHATPYKINASVGNIDTIERLYKQFLPSENTITDSKADVVVYGHIHVQYMQHLYNRTIINTGSVGNALDIYRNKEKDGNVKNTTVANYLVISGEFGSMEFSNNIGYELVSVYYDINKELSTERFINERDDYEEEIKYGKYREMSKLDSFFDMVGIDKNKI